MVEIWLIHNVAHAGCGAELDQPCCCMQLGNVEGSRKQLLPGHGAGIN